uniref:Cytochrome c oxidase subunit 3 n=1 Tax=Sycobia sp. 2 JXW-2020 TaxID=2781669 RepID=A0A8A6UQR4_9HYME|nr:cytochrome c oxidase subunit III [Sycobia sp. 2 JXW-2020]
MKMNLYQPFHLVSLSPWPLLTSLSLLMSFCSSLKFISTFNIFYIYMSLMILIMCLFQWWRDVIRESTFQGYHNKKVMSGLKMGMILFIISELFFFISIFWAFFHFSLAPDIFIYENWPPMLITPFNPYKVPLLNTLLLLSSAGTLTWCHYSILMSNKKFMIISMSLTLLLSAMFTYIQYLEYSEASFCINDACFGSVFFMSTGFHGFHVIIGSIFLFINFIRMFKVSISNNHHFGFEAAAWYWHFVDVVWLFLYLYQYMYTL